MDQGQGLNWRNVKYNQEEESLILSGLGITSIPEAIINLYHGERITHLDLSFNNLKTVDGISYFKHLESLVLDNNRIPMIGGGFDEFSRPVRIINPKLKVLSINNNRVTNLEAFLRNLSICFPNLTYLSMLRNPCCPDDLSSKWNLLSQWIGGVEYEEFRRKCVVALPRLKFLDSQDLRRVKAPATSSFDFPSGEKIMENLVKFKDTLVDVFTEDGLQMSPLPSSSQRDPGEHHGTYIRNRVEYIGKQSEGNRFIKNYQL